MQNLFRPRLRLRIPRGGIMHAKRYPAPFVAVFLGLALWLGAAPATHADTITYSGRAYGAQVVLVNPVPNVLLFSDTGNLPSSGGSLSATLLTILVGTTLSSHTISASTNGSAGVATSTAHQETVLAFSGQPAQLTADVVEAHSQASCGGASGSSVVTNLTFGGNAVVVTGQPNQTITFGVLATLVINEQIVVPGSPNITVNALHLTLGTGEQVILSSAHSDVNCVTSTRSTTWSRVKRLYH
jgi:hypothetical protein